MRTTGWSWSGVNLGPGGQLVLDWPVSGRQLLRGPPVAAMDVSLAGPHNPNTMFLCSGICWYLSLTPTVVTCNLLNPSSSSSSSSFFSYFSVPLHSIHGDINCLFSWYIVEILITSYRYEECSTGITSKILYSKRNLMMSCPRSHVTSIQLTILIQCEN